MRDRDPRIGGHRHGRCDARDHFKGNAFPDQFFQFFTAPPEDERISAFKTEHFFAFFRLPHQDPVDLILWHRMVSCVLAHIDHFRFRRDTAQDLSADKSVIDDHIRTFDQLRGLHREQARIARPGPGQPDFPGRSCIFF